MGFPCCVHNFGEVIVFMFPGLSCHKAIFPPTTVIRTPSNTAVTEKKAKSWTSQHERVIKEKGVTALKVEAAYFAPNYSKTFKDK